MEGADETFAAPTEVETAGGALVMGRLEEETAELEGGGIGAELEDRAGLVNDDKYTSFASYSRTMTGGCVEGGAENCCTASQA